MNKKQVIKYLVLILLLGTLLRFHNLGDQPLWLDEGYTLQTITWEVNGTNDATAVFNRAIEKESVPPTYFLMLYYWREYVGISEFKLRLPSAIFGILSLLMIFFIARKIFNTEIGLIATLLMAIAITQITFAQEARVYSLFVFLALVSTYFFIKLIHDNKFAYFYIPVTSLMLLTHYFGLIVVGLQGIVYFTYKEKWKCSMLKMQECFCSSLLLWIVFVPLLLLQIRTTNGFIKMILEYKLGLGFLAPLGAWVFVIPLIIAGLLFIYLERKYHLIENFTLKPIVWIIIFNVFLIGYVICMPFLTEPTFLTRFPLFLFPIFYTLFAVGLYKTKSYGLLLAVILVVSGLMLHLAYYSNDDRKEPWDDIAYIIQENEQPGEVIFIVDEDLRIPFKYYYTGTLSNLALKSVGNMTANNNMWDTVYKLTAAQNGLWYISSHNYRSQGFWEARLNETYNMTAYEEFNGIELSYFEVKK